MVSLNELGRDELNFPNPEKWNNEFVNLSSVMAKDLGVVLARLDHTSVEQAFQNRNREKSS